MARWLSTLAAVLVLGVADVSAADLQGRVDALVAQVGFRFRGDEATRREQLRAVEAVLIEWNRVDSLGAADANRQRLSRWVDEALVAVMPGGVGRVPAAPAFTEPAAIVAVAPTPQPEPRDERRVTPPRESVAVETERIADEGSQPPAASPRVNTAIPVAAATPPEAGPPEAGPTRRAIVASVGAQAVDASPNAAPRSPTESGLPTKRRVVGKPVVPSRQDAKRSRWSRTPAAAPLEWDDPFEPDPAASPNPLRGASRRHSTLRPTSREANAVTVDLAELEAQMRGYNGELRRLQAELLNRPARDIEELANAAERLGLLAELAGFLNLYRDGLSAAERRRLPMSLSLDLARELIRRRAGELLSETPTTRPVDRRVLRDLTDRMAGRDGLNAAFGR